MTTITAKVIKDSISEAGVRLTTVQMRYPRAIHSELMTHRVFSRNARSSRAVPVKTIIQEVIDDPFVPLHWGANQKGMQADAECNESVRDWLVEGTLDRTNAWCQAAMQAVSAAQAFSDAGYHKQVVNRLLEPFAHIDVLVTSTSWANFNALRDHKDAEPHIAILARAVHQARVASKPVTLLQGEAHLPFVEEEDTAEARAYLGQNRIVRSMPSFREIQFVLVKLSVARCARISYRPFDGNGDVGAECRRHDSLVISQPVHASPAEHQAWPDQFGHHGHLLNDGFSTDAIKTWKHPELHGNLTGWMQYRKSVPGEFVPEHAA